MIDQLIFYLKIGYTHILDISAYDHFLFLISITIPFTFKYFKNLFWIVTLFTIGHSSSIVLSTFDIIKPNISIIEFLIPVTIIFSAISNFFLKIDKSLDFKILFISLFFGIIHGFGFANYFNQITFDDTFDYFALLGFSFGVELAQILIVVSILIINSILKSVINKKYTYYIKICSIIVCILTFLLFT